MKNFNIHVEVFPDMFHDQARVHTSPASSRVATISGLASGTAHTVRVAAVYVDGTEAMSDNCFYTTPGKYICSSTEKWSCLIELLVQLVIPHPIFCLKHSILGHLVRELCGPLKETAVISLTSV